MPTPLVSICVPTYNGSQYLHECLNSVLSQSITDFEVLVVDDQSSDDTFEITKQYAKKDKRIKLYRNNSNLGLVGNWNRCIELANGEWIKFVFQDDIIKNNCLELMLYKTCTKTPFVICQRDFIFHPLTSKENRDFYLNTLPNIGHLFPNTELISPKQICEKVLLEPLNFFGEPTSTLIHHTIFKKFGSFNLSMVQICDLEYWIRVSINTGVKFIPSNLVQFRVHPSSTSSKNQDSQIYRSSHMDKLILLHEFAYNPFYEPLRKITHINNPTRNFKKETASRAFWLKNLALNSSSADHKLSPLTHWNSVYKDYPKLNSSLYLLPFQIKQWLNQKLLWRFNKKDHRI